MFFGWPLSAANDVSCNQRPGYFSIFLRFAAHNRIIDGCLESFPTRQTHRNIVTVRFIRLSNIILGCFGLVSTLKLILAQAGVIAYFFKLRETILRTNWPWTCAASFVSNFFSPVEWTFCYHGMFNGLFHHPSPSFSNNGTMVLRVEEPQQRVIERNAENKLIKASAIDKLANALCWFGAMGNVPSKRASPENWDEFCFKKLVMDDLESSFAFYKKTVSLFAESGYSIHPIEQNQVYVLA